MESLALKRRRARRIIQILKKEFPDPKSGLIFNSPFELLIKTILSAQCTDARVNQVGEQLFRKYSGPHDFIKAPVHELEEDIRPTGFFRNKARNIQTCCQTLVDRFDSQVPDTLEDLITLGGVGRKTANVILGNIHGKPAVVVDTHVMRISRLLKLTPHSTPEKIEGDLMKVLEEKDWSVSSHLFILHGRMTCIARRPRCPSCAIRKLCPSSRAKKTEAA